MEISWTDRVRNEEVLHRVKEERNIVRTIKKRKANLIGHILRRNCLLTHVIERKIEGRIEVTGRGGKRRKQLLDDLKEKKILEIERGSTRSHPVENSLWKRLRTCHKTDYRRNNLSELRVICAVAGDWAKQSGQSCGRIPIRRNQSRKVETLVLKRVITKGRNPEHCGLLVPRVCGEMWSWGKADRQGSCK
jgi:hypothetical protein